MGSVVLGSWQEGLLHGANNTPQNQHIQIKQEMCCSWACWLPICVPLKVVLHRVFGLLWEQPCVSTACSALLKPCKVSALSHSPELEAWWGTARKRISVSLLICQPLNSVNAYGCHAEQEKSLFHSGPLFHTFEPLSAITSFLSQVPRIPITSEWNLPTSHLFCTKLSWTFPYSPFCLSIQHFFLCILLCLALCTPFFPPVWGLLWTADADARPGSWVKHLPLLQHQFAQPDADQQRDLRRVKPMHSMELLVALFG